MSHLFISHSTKDGATIAHGLASALEAAGRRCWIAPRDVKPGIPYPGQIVAGIEGSAGLVLVVTPSANDSPDVLQELQLAATARKLIAPVVVGGAAPSSDIRYYIGVRHQIPWSNAQATVGELLRSFPVASSAPGYPADYPSAPPVLVDLFVISEGPNKIQVIQKVMEFTGVSLATAKGVIEGWPPVRVGMSMPMGRALEYAKALKDLGANVLPPVPAKK